MMTSLIISYTKIKPLGLSGAHYTIKFGIGKPFDWHLVLLKTSKVAIYLLFYASSHECVIGI